jgi:hypothetical protein
MHWRNQMPTLAEVIETFADSRRTGFGLEGLDTPLGAYLMCDAMSDAFIRFAAAAGYTGKLKRYDFHCSDERRNPDPSLYKQVMHDTMDDIQCCNGHVIVETEEFFIDFTAKQYHSQACYPHITVRREE